MTTMMMIQTSWRLSELVCVVFLPIGRGVFLSTLWRLSSFSYSYPPSLTLGSLYLKSSFSRWNFPRLILWWCEIIVFSCLPKLLWPYGSGCDVCLFEIIGFWKPKTGHFENPNSPTFCSSVLSLIWSRVEKIFLWRRVRCLCLWSEVPPPNRINHPPRSNSKYYCNALWFWEHIFPSSQTRHINKRLPGWTEAKSMSTDLFKGYVGPRALK